MQYFTSLKMLLGVKEKRLLNEAKMAKKFSDDNKNFGLSLKPMTKNGKADLDNWEA